MLKGVYSGKETIDTGREQESSGPHHRRRTSIFTGLRSDVEQVSDLRRGGNISQVSNVRRVSRKGRKKYNN